MTCNYFINVGLYLFCVLFLGQVSCDVGTACTANATICDDDLGLGYQCVNSLCQCTDNYYDSSGICTAKAGYRDACFLPGTDQCSVTNTECVDLGGSTGGPKCYCKEGYYTNNNQCFNAEALKTTPIGATSETNSAIVTWTLPSNSQFITSFSIEVNGTINKENIVSTSTSSEITNLLASTMYKVKVISIINTDTNSNYEIKSQPLSISTQQEPGSSCNPDEGPPCAGNLSCITNICRCENGHYVLNSYCYPKLAYGIDCSNPSKLCIDDLECYVETGHIPRCKCKTGGYRSNNQCKSVTELKPTGIRVTASTASSLTLTWNVPSDTYIKEFVISGTGNSFQDTIIPKTLRTGTLTDLSSGTDYTNIKITTIVKTDRGSFIDDAVSDQTLSDSTNPGKPGPLNSNNDYDTTRVMNIGFVKPTGGVDKYITVISGPGLPNPFKKEPTTNSITVPADKLQSGNTYNVSIISVYKDKNSLEFTGSFQTKSQGSSPVIVEVNSRSLIVSWSYPDEDMGELTAYILDVNIGSQCKQQFIYVTDINNKPTYNNCVGVTPTYITGVLRPSVTQLVTDLSPYINYTLIVTPYNGFGPGSSDSISAKTAVEAAGEPSNLNVPVSDIKATSFNVTWTKPTLKTGPTTYYLNVYEQKDLTNNKATQFVATFSFEGYDREDYLVVKDIVSYWYYRVELQASTSVGNSSIIKSTEFQTLSSAPGKVESFVISPIDGIYTTADVSWSCIEEKNRHGIIQNYILTSTLEYEGPKTIQQERSCRFSETVRVEPGQQNTFVLYATNMNFKGVKKQIDYKAPTGKPILAKEDKILVLKSEDIGPTSFSVTVCPRCLTDDTNGPIKITALLVCVKDKCDIKDNQLTLEDVKRFPTWKTAQANAFESPYRVTNDTWYGDKIVDEVKFVVGTDSASFCEKQAEGYFCNGPLNMNTEYQIIAVSCTEGGCSVSQPIGSFRTTAGGSTDDSISPTVTGIIGALVAITVMVIGIVTYCLVKRRKSKQKENKEGTVTYTSPTNETRDNNEYFNLRNRNDRETAPYYVNVPKQKRKENVEQGPYYENLNDNLTPTVYEIL